jgi:hypothetical protein
MSDYSTRTERIERFLSLAVGVAVIGAMLVSLYQARLAREQLRASAWPYLTQGNDWSTGDYRWVVTNQGVGPAKIRSVRVMADGHPVPTWNAAVRALTGMGDSALTYSSFGRGAVLPAGAARTLLTLPKGARAQAFWTAAQTRLRTVTCYCSVYDECWNADSDQSEPQPTDACHTDPATEFTQ